MKSILRVVACLFLIISLSSNATTIVLEWSGILEEIVMDSGSSIFSDVNIGETFSGTFTYDSMNYNPMSGDASFSGYELFGGGSSFNGFNYSSISLGISNNRACDSWVDPFNCNTYSNILNSTVTSGSSLDHWYLESILHSSTSSDSFFYIEYVSNSESIISDNSFQALPPFDLIESNENKRAIFWLASLSYSSSEENFGAWGYLDQVSVSEVPLPAGIYLFLSGLVGLGLMRGRNG